MRTVITKTIDGVEVVIGFDKLVLDPEATKTKAKQIAENNNEYKLLLREIDGVRETALLLDEKHESYLSEQQKIKKELQKKFEKLIGLQQKFFNANRVYFEPKIGEYVIDENDFQTIVKILKTLEPDEFVTRYKKIIKDRRGQKYYRKTGGNWKQYRVFTLDEKIPEDAILQEALSVDLSVEIADSLEEQRVSALPEYGREQEAHAAFSSVKREAALRVLESELLGEPISAVKQSLLKQKIKLEKKYGVKL